MSTAACRRASAARALRGALDHGLVEVVAAQEELGKDDEVDAGVAGVLQAR